MLFDVSKGIQGNIEDSLEKGVYNLQQINTEMDTRKFEDTFNREQTEQNYTNSYLDHVSSQQDITNLILSNMELMENLELEFSKIYKKIDDFIAVEFNSLVERVKALEEKIK